MFADLLCCLRNECIDAFDFWIRTLLADLAYRFRAIALDLAVSAGLTCQGNSLALSGSLVAMVLSSVISILHAAGRRAWESTVRIVSESNSRVKVVKSARSRARSVENYEASLLMALGKIPNAPQCATPGFSKFDFGSFPSLDQDQTFYS